MIPAGSSATPAPRRASIRRSIRSSKTRCPRCGPRSQAGADIVEFDIHPTTDGHFAVFHDWTVDCRTEGRGVTREHTLAQLKALDVGYGYTADGGKTFPFRGRGVGLMPSLDEVLDAFPGRRFLINIKSNDPAEGALLARASATAAGGSPHPPHGLWRRRTDRGDAQGTAGHPGDVAGDAQGMRAALHRDRLDRLCPRRLPQQPDPDAGRIMHPGCGAGPTASSIG